MKNNWPDNITIQQYLEGTLDKKQMHELEKRALEDPFLADALEGYAHTSATDHGLSILQRQLHERISHQQENKKVFDLSWQRLSIAAAAAVMFISAGVLFWMNSQLPENKLAANQKHVEVSITPVDSLDNDGPLVAAVPVKPDQVREPEVRVLDKEAYTARPTLKARSASRSYSSNKLNAEGMNRSQADLIAKKQPDLASTAPRGAVAGVSLKDSAAMPETRPAAPALSEVTVNSYAADSQRKAAVSGRVADYKNYIESNVFKAAPAGGWEAYHVYLKENIAKAASSIGQKGKVLIEFKVNLDGQLADFKIRKGLSAKADSLAIQIVKNGPLWKTLPDVQDARIQLDLEF